MDRDSAVGCTEKVGFKATVLYEVDGSVSRGRVVYFYLFYLT